MINQNLQRHALISQINPAARLAALVVLCLCVVLPAHAQFGPGGGGGGNNPFGGGGGGNNGSRSRNTRTYPGNGAVGDAVISIDPETRSLIVIADEKTRAYISQVVSNLDRPKPQVLIKVVFIEVQHNNASDLGIEGGWGKTINNDPTKASAVNGFGLSGLSSITGSNFNAFGQPLSQFAPISPITAQGAGLYQILNTDYQVTLRAIAQTGKAKVLSRPSIVARNNQPATINVGQNVPLVTGVRYDNFGNVINTIAYQSVGIILRVTPFITSDGLVEMIVSPETSSLVSDRSQWVPIASGASAPIINSRSADTVVVTPDGQTVIIGGLMEDSKAESEIKIPYVADLPIIGSLFKRKLKNDTKTELLIFLTPHIIQAPAEMASLAGHEGAKAQIERSFTEEELQRFLEKLPVKPPPASHEHLKHGHEDPRWPEDRP